MELPKPSPPDAVSLDVLERIEALVSDDWMWSIEWDLANGRIKEPRLCEAAMRLSNIYQLAHAFNPRHSCYAVHDDWRKEPGERKEGEK